MHLSIDLMNPSSIGVGLNGCRKDVMPWSEEYPESHVRQLNAPQDDAKELGDLLEHKISN